MKKLITVLFIILGVHSVEAQPITILSMGFGKDFINGQPLINANFSVQNAYASYSISIDNIVKSYDIGWVFRCKHFYFAPTLGITAINAADSKRFYLQTATDNNLTVVEIHVNVDNNNVTVKEVTPIASIPPGNTVVSIIDRINTNNRNYPNIGIFTGYKFNDGFTLFVKGTNNSFGIGMGFILN